MPPTPKTASLNILISEPGAVVSVDQVRLNIPVGKSTRVGKFPMGKTIVVEAVLPNHCPIRREITVKKPEVMNLDLTWEFKNPIGMAFVRVEPGSFTMGSETGQKEERPAHDVTIRAPFFMGKYEVTQAQWLAVMKYSQSDHQGPLDFPADNISWNDAWAFISALNRMDPQNTYRLPTEAEWEYACRAGTTGDFAGELTDLGWFANNSGNQDIDFFSEYKKVVNGGKYPDQELSYIIKTYNLQPHPVGNKLPNDWGLYDMHGNVWEWCQDTYHGNYVGAPFNGEAWENGGTPTEHTLRGGNYYSPSDFCRSSFRLPRETGHRCSCTGFRVVAIPKKTDGTLNVLPVQPKGTTPNPRGSRT